MIFNTKITSLQLNNRPLKELVDVKTGKIIWKTNERFLHSLCFKAETNSEISLQKIGSEIEDVSLEYTRDTINWIPYTIGETISISAGDKIHFQTTTNTTSFSLDEENYFNFNIIGDVYASGNLISLIDRDLVTDEITTPYTFYKLFENCTGLKSSPYLSVSTLSNNCCEYMYSGCTKLESTSDTLPALVIGNGCYKYMFLNCTNIKETPSLVATDLANECYYGMFKGCSGLTTAEPLLAKTLTPYCYYSMFEGCTSLVNPPQMLAENLNEYCCGNMFRDCTSLTSAPILYASQLVSYCYVNMFENCTSLSNIDVNFILWNEADAEFGTSNTATLNWVKNVAETGTFYCSEYLSIEFNDSRIPLNWKAEIKYEVGDLSKILTFTSKDADAEITLTKVGTPPEINSLEYTFELKDDDTVYTSYTIGETITIPANKSLYIKTNKFLTTLAKDDKNYHKFTITGGNVEASGSLMSLIDPTCYRLTNTYAYSFSHLFDGCKNLVGKAPELPATSLGSYCYQYTFKDTNIEEMSELPATTLSDGCYQAMYYFCYALTKVKPLNATNLKKECYQAMFYGCKTLKKAQDIIPARQMYIHTCNAMYCFCYELTDIPRLPATKLGYQCYSNMFKGCKELVDGPYLPAYITQQDNITKNDRTGIYRCYTGMFQDAVKLSSVSVNFTFWSSNISYKWLDNVSDTGTLGIMNHYLEPNTMSSMRNFTYPETWGYKFIAYKPRV